MKVTGNTKEDPSTESRIDSPKFDDDSTTRKHNPLKMMRFVGNTVAKVIERSIGRGMQYRGYSSGALVTTGKKIVEHKKNKIVGYCFVGASGGLGYVFGVLTLSPVEAKVQDMEENIIRDTESQAYLIAAFKLYNN